MCEMSGLSTAQQSSKAAKTQRGTGKVAPRIRAVSALWASPSQGRTPGRPGALQERAQIWQLTKFDPLFKEYSRHPWILDVVTSLIGPDVKIFLDQTLCNAPHGPEYQPQQPHWSHRGIYEYSVEVYRGGADARIRAGGWTQLRWVCLAQKSQGFIVLCRASLPCSELLPGEGF